MQIMKGNCYQISEEFEHVEEYYTVIPQ